MGRFGRWGIVFRLMGGIAWRRICFWLSGRSGPGGGVLTGAALAGFNHPLKVAGEIGGLDAISGGRLDCGFGRAFLLH